MKGAKGGGVRREGRQAPLEVIGPGRVASLDASLDAILDESIPLGDLEPVDAHCERFRARLAEHWPNTLG